MKNFEQCRQEASAKWSRVHSLHTQLRVLVGVDPDPAGRDRVEAVRSVCRDLERAEREWAGANRRAQDAAAREGEPALGGAAMALLDGDVTLSDGDKVCASGPFLDISTGPGVNRG